MFVLVLAFSVMVVAWFIYRRSVSYDVPPSGVANLAITASPDAAAANAVRWGDNALEFHGGIAQLSISGDATQLGAAQGRLLATSIAAAIPPMRTAIEDAVTVKGWWGEATRSWRIDWRYRFIDDGMTERDRQWVAGMVRGAAASGVTLSYEDVLRAQVALDVGAASPDTEEGELRAISRSLTFVTPQQTPPLTGALAGPAGHAWIGHITALPGLADGGDQARATPVLTIAHPQGHLAWAGIGWPGLAGVLSGVNSEDIAVFVHPVRTFDVRPTRTARPILMLARDVLESAHTLDEAVGVLQHTTTLGAARFVVVEGHTGRWAIVERTPVKAQLIRSPPTPAVGDVLTSVAFAEDPENDRARRMLPTMARLDRVNRLVRGPLADAASVVALLRDRKTVDEMIHPIGHRGVIADPAAVQITVLDPSTMTLWIADGGTSSRFRAFDLRRLLLNLDDRPAPPNDIAADTSSGDLDAAAIVDAARVLLRAARHAAVSGDDARADELATLAMARAPQLPEAVELAATIARRRGQRDRARTLFDTWFTLGADMPAQAADAHNWLGQ